MSKIKIKNFGPIKEGYLSEEGWLDVKKVTVFIGNQGSGKSTVAKLISTMTWIEKALVRGDFRNDRFSAASFLGFLKYQRINNYYNNDKTVIQFEGNAFYIEFNYANQFPVIRKLNGKSYKAPKIMYVPAERNFLSSVSDAFNVKGLPESLFTFAEELRLAQKNFAGKVISLPINDYGYKYEEDKDISYVVGRDHQINILEASSGLQAAIPLYLVTRFLSNQLARERGLESISVNNRIRMNNEIDAVMKKPNNTLKERELEILSIQEKYINKSLMNIVEEPEQNLFPSSQHKILNSLLEFNGMNKDNKLIMTTHSPYLINYLTLSVKANSVKEKLTSDESKKKLQDIVPLKSTVSSDDLVIYELNENEGTIIKLKDYKGLPSDDNYLNSDLEYSNELFAQLQEIEKGWR